MKTVHYHTAKWCAPCRAIKPLAKKITEQAGAQFHEIDIDTQSQEALPGILGVPTIVITENHQIVATLSPDMISAPSLRKALA